MSRKLVLILVFLMLYGSFAFLFAKSVVANLLPSDDFAIRADGEIDPATAPVATLDNVTYTLTHNVSLFNHIRVERSNILIDGADYTVANEQWGEPGMRLDDVNNVTVRNLNFRNSWGIWLGNTSDCVLAGNNFTDSHLGFLIGFSFNVTLVQNTMKNTTFGEIDGDSISHFLHSIDTSNTIDGKPVYYLINQKNLTINSSAFPEIGFLALVNSTDIAIEGLTLANCRQALLFAFTNNSEITGNILKNNVIGISLISSSNNVICENEMVDNEIPIYLDVSSCNNTITENSINGIYGPGIQLDNHSNINTVSYNNVSGLGIGIWLYSFSSDNVFIGNKIMNCSEGVTLSQCQNNTFIKNSIMNTTTALRLEQVETCNNTFFDNNFEGNINRVFILGTIGSNVWDNGVEGNYWSDYNGTDNNQDGIGDTPYVIDENNIDHYPLMGDFYGPWKADTGQLDVISNSTVTNFWLTYDAVWGAGTFLHDVAFDVSGNTGTNGFCRVHIPFGLFNGTYRVLVNDSEVPYALLPCSNSADSYLYFAYAHSTKKVEIMSEFPTFLILPLFMIATLLVITAYRRKHLN